MRGAALLAALAAAALARGGAAKGGAYEAPKPVQGGKVVKVKLDFNVGKAAPDCFLRNVFTVNGKFGVHTIQAHRGDVLEVEVTNSIPADYPDVHEGITLHWHGLTMPGSDFWYDGAAYVTQCPLKYGKKQTYRFLLVDGPGLFWWHSHVGLQAMDGIFGPLVILPPRDSNATASFSPAADGGDLVMAVGDWWHATGAATAFPLGRPFDKAKQTNKTGPYYWSDVPQAIHFNGRALWMDCALDPYLSNATVPCKPEAAWVGPGRAKGNVGATQANPGCARANFTVTPGKTYLWRVINVGALMDINVCVQGHNLTIVAADGVPIEPLNVGSCFDINLGQRYDVLMKADATPGAYWVTGQANYRPASPNGYAVLKYDTDGVPALPPTPAPSGHPVPPWGPADIAKIKMPEWLAGRADPPPGVVVADVAHIPTPNATTLALPPNSTRFVHINNTQPILPTGQVRWALNQVVMSETPKCDAFAEHVQRSGARFLESDFDDTVKKGEGADWGVSLGVQDTGVKETPIYLYGRNGSAPTTPVVGKQVILLDQGDVVDVVIQNLPPGDLNGAVQRPKDAPVIMEQHPFHIHGVHFWLLGSGVGRWSDALIPEMNWWNPPMRDTAMLPVNGWIMFRFVAAYPGTWMLHCHSLLHLYMGQALLFVVAPDSIPAPPRDLPYCPDTCSAAIAPWDQAYVAAKWPNTPYDVGPLEVIDDTFGAATVEGAPADAPATALTPAKEGTAAKEGAPAAAGATTTG